MPSIQNRSGFHSYADDQVYLYVQLRDRSDRHATGPCTKRRREEDPEIDPSLAGSDNYDLVRRALLSEGRGDLIGDGEICLIPRIKSPVRSKKGKQ